MRNLHKLKSNKTFSIQISSHGPTKSLFPVGTPQLFLGRLGTFQVILNHDNQASLLCSASPPLVSQSVSMIQTSTESPSEHLIVKDCMCLCHDGPSLLGSYLSGHGSHLYILSTYFSPQLRIPVKSSQHSSGKFKIRSSLCGWLLLLKWMKSKHEPELHIVWRLL